MEIAKKNSFNGSIGMLNSVLWRKMAGIYISIVKGIVLYGVEVWTMNRKHEERLSAVDMDFWQRTAVKSERQRVRNTHIGRIMEV